MGAEKAIIASQAGAGLHIQHFNDTVVVKLRLTADDEGFWLLLGRVKILNQDGDPQIAHAKLVHQQDVVLDDVDLFLDDSHETEFVLRAGLGIGVSELITLQCNTFNGTVRLGSIVALKVGHLEFQ